MPSNKKVFINCPFDNEFFPILKSILFALVYLGFEPLISETNDSGESRIRKLKKFIKEANLSIHDLSRAEPMSKDELPRFNMPFELGLDFGSRYFNAPKYGRKKFLILEANKYHYQKVISDISGHDTVAHRNDPELAIKAVRNWLKLNFSGKRFARAIDIFAMYEDYRFESEPILLNEGINPHDISENLFTDVIEEMTIWIRNL